MEEPAEGVNIIVLGETHARSKGVVDGGQGEVNGVDPVTIIGY
jgi:hypothetical protein